MRPVTLLPASPATLEPTPSTHLLSWCRQNFTVNEDLCRYVNVHQSSLTHEFCRERARITQRLIEEKWFNTVVLEANWLDVYRVNRYIRGTNNDRDAKKALSGFTRFPRWMWRNHEVRALVEWLRAYNDTSLCEQFASVSTGWTYTACPPRLTL